MGFGSVTGWGERERMSGKKGKSNGVQVFIHKNSPGSELQGEVDKGRRKRRMKRGERKGYNLELLAIFS